MTDAYPKFIGMRAGEDRDLEIAPGVKMSFCWCTLGNFLMGSPESEKDSISDANQVVVRITKGFWMAKTQVTQKQWVAIMGNNPSYFIGDNLPVESVIWDDAQEFLEKVNAKIGNTEGGQIALPTEAQWEYACRAGELGPYSGGTIDEVAWYWENSEEKTHPVGMKKPNAWGLHDMHGNLWEMCEDWYDDDLSGGVDPTGPSSGPDRVRRGGGYFNDANCCRASHRGCNFMDVPSDGTGLRPVMIPSEQESKFLNLGDVELPSLASSRLEEHQHEPAIREIKAALVDHRYAEAMRVVEKLLSDTDTAFIGKRAGEERDWKIAPGLKMTFCWCPLGSFLMGSPSPKWYSFLLPPFFSKIDEPRRWSENQVRVTMSSGYWIAKTQVTQVQWYAVMGKNPSKFKGDDLPVVRVSGDDIQEFMNKVNKSGEIPVGMEIRLPTEAQWEYACRAGEKEPYPGGTLDQVAWYDGNSLGKIRPVGTKKPNAWGLHDMLGNVWERCADWYEHALSGGVDPSGPLSSMFDCRVNRGGSWRSNATWCRAACRVGVDYRPFSKCDDHGFRPVLVPSE